jgi:hypothetical protein
MMAKDREDEGNENLLPEMLIFNSSLRTQQVFLVRLSAAGDF